MGQQLSNFRGRFSPQVSPLQTEQQRINELERRMDEEQNLRRQLNEERDQKARELSRSQQHSRSFFFFYVCERVTPQRNNWANEYGVEILEVSFLHETLLSLSPLHSSQDDRFSLIHYKVSFCSYLFILQPAVCKENTDKIKPVLYTF